MARSFSEIKRSMTSTYLDNPVILEKYELQEGSLFDEVFSKLSIESILFDVVSMAILVLEQIFDQHKVEVSELIFEQKISTDRWHRNKALDFQYGFDLIEDSDQFNNENATETDIQNSKVITHAAVIQSESKSSIIVKIATEENDKLIPVASEIETSFTAYMEEVSPSGTDFIIINQKADLLLPTLVIYRDPLIINENGLNILTGERSVEAAITKYLKELDFNGQFIEQSLCDALRNVDGVLIVEPVNMLTAVYSVGDDDYDDLSPINVRHVAVSGHFIVEDFTNISYVV